jgi:NADPH:quinone reductase
VKYRHVVVERTGAPEVLRVVEDELQEPGPGQARVKILAADVSFSDVNMRRGRYPGAPRPPFSPGYAMVGMVDQLGPQTSGQAHVSPPAVGQVVAALTFYGSYSQYLCLPAEWLVPMPPGLDPAEAACLVLNYVAAGGVGVAFLELGQLSGLVMYGTASKPKHRLVVRLGATPIDYRSEDFVARIAALTGGVGVDAAFDPMGFAHLRQSERAVRSGGGVVGYGFYTAANHGRGIVLDVLTQYLWLTLWSLPPKRKRTAFYDIRPLKRKHPEWFREDLTALFDLLAAGKLHPVISARLPLDEVVRAHELVEHAEVEGKVVLIPNP